jgi:hypothetical protein
MYNAVAHAVKVSPMMSMTGVMSRHYVFLPLSGARPSVSTFTLQAEPHVRAPEILELHANMHSHQQTTIRV